LRRLGEKEKRACMQWLRLLLRELSIDNCPHVRSVYRMVLIKEAFGFGNSLVGIPGKVLDTCFKCPKPNMLFVLQNALQIILKELTGHMLAMQITIIIIR
jgi:hypothetical protein